MIGLIRITDRGSTPRNMKKAMNSHLKESWAEAGRFFHRELRPNRFTPQHARFAHYTKRKGENLSQGSKRWKRSYYGRKFRGPFGGGRGRADPLVYSGETQRAMRLSRISSTSKGVRIVYPGSRKLNFRHPKSRVRGGLEFRRILDSESEQVAEGIDVTLDNRFRKDNSVTVDTVTF